MLRALSVGVALGLLCPGQAALGQETDTLVLTLGDVERRALEDNPLLQQPRVDVEMSRAQRSRASRARFLPQFNLRNVWGPIPRQRGEFTPSGVLISPDSTKGLSDLRWFTDVQLQLLQPIYTFGRVSSTLEAAEHQVAASEAGLDATRTEVLRQARELYWSVALAAESERIVDDVLGEVEEADSTLQEQYEEGTATQNDLFQFEIFRYEIHKQEREVLDRGEQARATLRAALRIEDDRPFRLDTDALEPVEVSLDSLESYLEAARRSRPELQQLRAGIAARNSLYQAERSARWPELFVGGEVRFNVAPSRFDPENPFWDDQTNFGRGGLVVGFNWDLNFWQQRDQIRIAEYETERLRSQLPPLTELVRNEVREAYLRARRARTNVEEGGEALQASENWLRAELQTYDIGIGDIQDVIDAFRANIEMRSEQLENIFELNRAVAELSRAVGRDVSFEG